MMLGRMVFGPSDSKTWPTSSAPSNPPSGGFVESKPIPANVLAETRARAYEMAKAECPPGSPRSDVMAAADEIFQYLMYGRKPAKAL
jgi:hypothetical protein